MGRAAVKREYRRHLPHQVPDLAIIFLTWNLKGAIPQVVAERLRRDRDQFQREPPRADESIRDRALRLGKLLFARADAFLDHTVTGPRYLEDPTCAGIVQDSILFGAGERYELFAWCVMANHVHVLLQPWVELAKVTQGIKGFTAYQINQLQGQHGRTFWQDESYDHWARDEEELLRILEYIEANPVRAGLCGRAEDWPWSSARLRKDWPAGEPYRRSTFPC